MPLGFTKISGFVLSTLILTSCNGGTAVSSGGVKTHFEKSLAVRGRTLPNTVNYDDFYRTAYNMGMVEVDEFLSASNIPIKGDGDGRYLLRADLLRACGESCTGDEGLGKILWAQTVYKQKK
ncbi:MAG: hypothetical protein R1F54_11030 [Candidatus Zeuxoniibacter abyssi]|nr:MAG: hypothetical protein R1F54_11030 [Candidatus Persebacteraceae bacterium AB1(2)]